MKPIKWTKEIVLELALTFKAPFEFKKAYPSAYKALRRYNLVSEAFPPTRRERRRKLSRQELLELMQGHSSRSEFQKADQSAYNAAKALKLIAIGFPRSKRYDLFGREPYTEAELIAKCKAYASIKEFSEKESGAYQVAQRKGLLALHGPKPTQGTSQAEQELLSFLQSLVPDFKTKRFANDYELDCYSEALQLGVEYNGLYWHSEEKKGKQYHIDKTKHFEILGIRVIHVWEHEWRDRRAQVQNYLQSACGVNPVRVGARKCVFKDIYTGLARAFLAEQHIQGAPGQVSLAIGAYYNDLLISVATFGPHHRKGEAEVVLNRFACLPGHTVTGGLAKVSRLASEKLGPLKSWADYSKSQARGYLAAGWVLESALRPDYFYSDAQGRKIAKQSRRKGAVGTPLGMTEAEHAKADGLYRIWDCGKLVLSYKKAA